MQPEFIAKHAVPVPRYTSYPTAPHFNSTVTAETYRKWLAAIPYGTAASLYVHIPFCDKLCWYCGCNTKATERYEPIAEYLQSLRCEIASVADVAGAKTFVTHMHWGGGSPSIVSAVDIERLAADMRQQFNFDPDAEVAVEVDPRNIGRDKINAFAKAGFNRVSVGVQDFSVDVQAAINRQQSYDMTANAITRFRDAGITSVNIDLVYGLPRQTRDSVEATIEQVLTLAPDRIALFGYAHLPARLVHQRLIKDVDLPKSVERFAQANRAANRLMAAGYVRIGLDHFAKPTDALARGRVQRNFQGYTTDTATTLIGLGASSIGRLEEGYVQNAVPAAEYARQIECAGLATAKGRAFTAEDKARGYAIEQLLCNLDFSAPDLITRFGELGQMLAAGGQALIESDTDGLVSPKGNDGSFAVTEKGRLFLRSICACFDAYLDQSTAIHAAGV
ncbi:MAG: oxygen-independent coproporphyrinogen III oxidase [Hyphomicrobiaceae bacterium]|nr:oxygen-independent coproporphyrinogen III oxidase [Hyphomicrobiaceae bacterium]